MNSKIIGGEYTIDRNAALSNADHEMAYFSCGRTALLSVLEREFPDKRGRVLIPDHICGSVPLTVSKHGMECLFYHIGEDFRTLKESLFERLPDAEAVVLVNYFGMIPFEEINGLVEEIRKAKGDSVIIVDDVQNYYGLKEEHGCDYAFTSFRKWFPVPDGADLFRLVDNRYERLFPNIPKTCGVSLFSKYKFAGNLLKNYRDIVGDEICLDLIEKGEQLISKDPGYTALDWTADVFSKLDLDAIAKKRQENASILHEGLDNIGITHIFSPGAVPLFVPVIIKSGRDKLRSRLFDNQVFCPVHWNEEWKKEFKGVDHNSLSDHELSLICDQRYGREEMILQLEILKNECLDI